MAIALYTEKHRRHKEGRMSLVKDEPVLTTATVAIAIVTVLNAVGVAGVDVDTVTNVVGAIVGILAAFGVRSAVTPVDPTP